MSASLRLGNQHAVTVEFTGLQVYPGAGVHRAALIARLNPGQGAAGVSVELLCQVYLAGPPRLWLGDARAERTATLNTFELREEVNFPLTDLQIAGIEE